MQGHVFISYVREDAAAVNRLRRALEGAGIKVWLDIEDVGPGDLWRIKVKQATKEAVAFLACFSQASHDRPRTEQRVELVQAIEEQRRRGPGRTWLIPIRLADLPLPDDYDLGNGRSLEDLAWIDLFGKNRRPGLTKLIDTIHRLSSDQTPTRRPPSRPWWRRGPAMGAVLGALVLASGAIAWRTVGDDSGHRAGTSTDGNQPECNDLPEEPTVEPGPSSSLGQVDRVRYEVSDGRDPVIDLNGRLSAAPGLSESLYVFKTADPNTHDSTPEKNPGSEGYFVEGETPVGDDGCFALGQRLGYDCVGGVEFRFLFTLVPDTVAAELVTAAEANKPDGLQADQVLENPNVAVLATVDVPTASHPDCLD